MPIELVTLLTCVQVLIFLILDLLKHWSWWKIRALTGLVIATKIHYKEYMGSLFLRKVSLKIILTSWKKQRSEIIDWLAKSRIYFSGTQSIHLVVLFSQFILYESELSPENPTAALLGFPYFENMKKFYVILWNKEQ